MPRPTPDELFADLPLPEVGVSPSELGWTASRHVEGLAKARLMSSAIAIGRVLILPDVLLFVVHCLWNVVDPLDVADEPGEEAPCATSSAS